MTEGSRAVIPPPGRTPTRAWVSAKTARSEATRKSQPEGDLQPAGEGGAVDRPEHGRAEQGDLGDAVGVVVLREVGGAVPGGLLEVDAGAERRVAPGEHDRAHTVVLVGGDQRGVQRADELAGERVARLRPVQREHADVPVVLDQQRLGHDHARSRKAGFLRKSQLVIFSGASRSQACRPSGTNSSLPPYLRAKSCSGPASSATGSAPRGTSPTTTARPLSSTPRSSQNSVPASTTTAIRGSRARSVQRWLLTSEFSQSAAPSQTNHSGATCGAPSPPTVATRQVRSPSRNVSRSSGVMAIARPRRCSFDCPPSLISAPPPAVPAWRSRW